MTKATIFDVAEAAAVSPSTVSRVMNGNSTVDPVLATRVREAAAALNYTASPLARSLVLRRTQTVAVVVPDLGNPTFQAILRGVSRAAASDGFHVLIADSAEVVDEERILATETRRRTDGVILCAPRMSDDQLDSLIPSLSPVVIVNRRQRAGAPVVSVDYKTGQSALVEHLYGLGHRALVYLAGASASASNAQRLAALAEFRASHPDVRIDEVPCGVDFRDGAAAAEAVRASGATAVIAYNDLVAMGLLSALEEIGVRVPEDVSVVGFDDIPFARFTTPPLTTASVAASDVGEQAWMAMSMLLSDRQPSMAASFRPGLEIRASTRAPVSMS